ncbi:hypothetical protein [Sulfurimonas sp.]|uniref:hypothetical protein n=1 Tax=Sulfurimonas sp. TaxID=2022749 RepID=UPI00260CA796|nr:hypothetical protein [Sulfurimonas sp.]MDD3854548.1 hypothetical protein [Sulfurimonas sp.]
MNIQSIPVSSLVALDTPQKKLFDSSIKDIINTLEEPSESQRQQAHLNNRRKQKHIPFIVQETIL